MICVGHFIESEDGFLKGIVTNWWLDGKEQILQIEASNQEHKVWTIRANNTVSIIR